MDKSFKICKIMQHIEYTFWHLLATYASRESKATWLDHWPHGPGELDFLGGERADHADLQSGELNKLGSGSCLKIPGPTIM